MEQKAIFAKEMNNQGQTINIEYKYIDTDALFDTLKTMLSDEFEKWFESEENHKGFYFDDDQLDEYVEMLVADFNKDMKKYLHQNNHRISGCFNNLDYDFNYHKYAIINGIYDTDKLGGNDYPLADAIKRLDNGEISEDANTDRQALTDWLLDTTGTFGIKYNFIDYINELFADYLYCNELDELDD